MQERSAGAARAIHQFFSEHLEIFRVVVIVIADHLHQTSPSAPKPNNLITFAQGAERYGANCRIQAWNIASSGQNSDDTFPDVDVGHNDIPRCSVENERKTIIHSRTEFRKPVFRIGKSALALLLEG
jgi:hypothetical protein